MISIQFFQGRHHLVTMPGDVGVAFLVQGYLGVELAKIARFRQQGGSSPARARVGVIINLSIVGAPA